MKKKILLSGLSAAVAVTAACSISIPVASNNNASQQSTSVVTPDQQPNPTPTPGTDDQGQGGNNQGNDTPTPTPTPGDDQSGNQGGDSQGGDQSGETPTPTPEPVVENFAFAPSVASYTKKITSSEAYDTDSLNTYLKTNVGTTYNETDWSGNFSNVSIKYVDDSANFNDATFSLIATPNENYTWTNGTKNAVNVTVYLSNLEKIQKASWVPTGTFKYGVDITPQIAVDTAKLNTYLTSSFDATKISLPLTNLTATYVANSANYANKTFKISLTPATGYTWSNGTNEAKQVDVALNVIPLDNTKVVTLPSQWTLNAVGNADKFGWQPDLASRTSKWGLDVYRDLSSSPAFKNLTYVGVDASVAATNVSIQNGTEATFGVKLQPASGYYWSDGSNGTKTVTAHVISQNRVQLAANNDGALSSIYLQKDTNGLPKNYWVSNFIYKNSEIGSSGTIDQRLASLKTAAEADLKASYPSYNFTVSGFWSMAFPSYTWAASLSKDMYNTAFGYNVTATDSSGNQIAQFTGYAFQQM